MLGMEDRKARAGAKAKAWATAAAVLVIEERKAGLVGCRDGNYDCNSCDLGVSSPYIFPIGSAAEWAGGA